MQAIPSNLCFLNGDYLPLNEAKVSVLDRGFIFGDGIYEVVPVYGHKLFCFDAHWARLCRSLNKLRLENPYSRDEWLAHGRRLVAAQNAPDQLLYIQVTRGVAGRDHVMPQGISPTVFMMTNPMKPLSAESRQRGVACVTAEDFRWSRGDIKSTSLLGNVMARQISADQGAVETILFRDDNLTEASSSNVWVVRDGAVFGPPKSEWVLEGIRYDLLRSLCEQVGVAYQLRPISRADVSAADELLLSSASKEVLAVTTLDGQAVGHGDWRGRPGSIYTQLYNAYQQAKQTLSL